VGTYLDEFGDRKIPASAAAGDKHETILIKPHLMPVKSLNLDVYENEVYVTLLEWRRLLSSVREDETFLNRTLAEAIRSERNDPAGARFKADLVICWGLGTRKARESDRPGT